MILLLAIIYLTFISLGLPDSLFGTAWPVMHLDFNVNENFASIYMIITAILSGGVSFFAGAVIRKVGTGIVTVCSVALTAAGMLIISFSPYIWVAMIGSVLMGLGAGAIDTGLNNFVSLHYKASHMNWLHCFWGVGVTLSPLIMSAFLDSGNNWRGGYLTVALIQFGITFTVLLSMPLWKKYDKQITPDIAKSKDDAADTDNKDAVLTEKTNDVSEDRPRKKQSAFKKIIKTKGLFFSVLSLGFYCGMEFLVGTWGASYIVNVKLLSAAAAARWVSLYYGGIMIGRFLSGFLSYKLNDKQLIRLGICVSLAGMVVMALPVGEYSLIGLVLVGIGFGPVFPSTLHATSTRFGVEYSADYTGIQMGGAYVIGWIVQLTFGFVAPATTFAFLPYLMLVLAVLVLIAAETVNKKTAHHFDKKEIGQ